MLCARSSLGLKGVLVALLAVGCGGGLELEFLAPQEQEASNGPLGVALKVAGGTPDRVDLYANAQWLARLDEASYVWDTRLWPEGAYTLEARAQVGNRYFLSSPRAVTVDRTPPGLVSQQPLPGSEAAVDSPIALQFSEPLAPGSLLTAALVVEVSGVGAETLWPSGLSEDGKTLLFPRMGLPVVPPRTVTARLSGEVADRAGNRASETLHAVWSWEVPELLSLGNPMSILQPDERPSFFDSVYALRLDEQGRTLVGGVTSRQGVLVRRWDGSSWETAGLYGQAENGASLFALCLDARAVPTTAFIAYDSNPAEPSQPLSRITTLQWDGRQWDFLGSPSSYTARSLVNALALGLTAGGLPRMLWFEYTPPLLGTVPVLYWHRLPGTWTFEGGAGPQLTDTLDLGARPVMAVNELGNSALAAWGESSTSGSRIGLRQLMGDTWVDISEERSPLTRANPSAVLRADETPVVAWTGSSAIEVRQRVGGTWLPMGSPIPTSTSELFAVSSALAVDATGRLMLAWSKPGLVEVWQWDGSSWARLATRSHSPSAVPAVAFRTWPVQLRIDSTGAPVLLWSTPDDAGSVHSLPELYRLNR